MKVLAPCVEIRDMWMLTVARPGGVGRLAGTDEWRERHLSFAVCTMCRGSRLSRFLSFTHRTICRGPGISIAGGAGSQAEYCPAQCLHCLVLERQLPHKTVNLIFELAIVNKKLTILGGG